MPLPPPMMRKHKQPSPASWKALRLAGMMGEITVPFINHESNTFGEINGIYNILYIYDIMPYKYRHGCMPENLELNIQFVGFVRLIRNQESNCGQLSNNSTILWCAESLTQQLSNWLLYPLWMWAAAIKKLMAKLKLELLVHTTCWKLS